MEDESASCLNPVFYGKEEKENVELYAETDFDHVPLRQKTADANDEVELPFKSSRDSLALLSVYRYARKIKSFLGLENPIEELQLDEDGSSIAKDLFLNEISGSSNDGLSENNNENNGKLSENEIIRASDGDASCDDDNKELDRISSGDVDCVLLTDKCEDDRDSNLTDQIDENITDQNLFRTEVNILIEDFRNNVIEPPNIAEVSIILDNTVPKKIEMMDKPLVSENKTQDIGLNLNDESNILKDELILTELPCREEKSSNGGGVETVENIFDSTNDSKTSDEKSNDKPIEDSVGDFKNGNILGENISDKENETEQECFMNSNSLVEGNLQKEVLENSIEKNDDIDVNTKTEKDASNGDTYISESPRKLAAETDEKFVVNNVKEKMTTNENLSNFKSLKAHIQYENALTKQPASKGSNHSKNQNITHKSEISEDTECGFSIFRPQWLQPFATVKTYVILYSIIGILHGSYYAYLIGTLSTLEKRYAFESKVSGTIMIVDEIIPLLLGVIIGYYAGRANRPRMIAFGMLLSAGCCFCTCLPYFIYGTAKNLGIENVLSYAGPEFCDLNSGRNECKSEDQRATLPAVLLLMFGSFLKGFGNLAYYAIGLVYLDDNSNKKSTPIYLAVALALRLLGPLVGFLLSSVFLKFYENPAHDPGYGPDDPRWIGAWWIGFFLQGILLVIFTLPIALFPRRLPGQRKVERTAPGDGDSLKQIFMGLVSALKRLGTNPVFVLIIVNTNMKIFGHYGHSIMVPKYMENQFRLSASEASLYSGATAITFVMLSTILGGYLIWRFRPRIKVLLGGMITSEIILCVGFLILIVPRCQVVDMMNFGTNQEGLVLSSACNQMCDCSTTSYTPVCGPDGTTYFSPCYAGCTQEIVSFDSSKKITQFSNCSCVASSVDQPVVLTISEGVCPDENCWSQAIAYLIVYFTILTISNAFTVAHSMILLRSVHPDDKSMALGTFETFICLFGFIPFPVTFGALVDSACLVWEKSCEETGNCWFYDMNRYSYLLHGVAALFCCFSVMCLIGLYFLSPRVRDLYEEDEEKEYVDIKLDTVSGSVTKL